VGYPESANFCKQRVNSGWDCLYTHLLPETSPKHEVEQNLDIIRYLGGKIKSDNLETWLDAEDEAFAENFLADHPCPTGSPLIAFGLGAGNPKRIWPLLNFIQLAAWLKRTYGAYILVLGEKAEQPLGSQLHSFFPDIVANISGRTTLRQAAALLKRCALYVGNDTGLMHLAAATGTPLVAISCHPLNALPDHPNSPRRFGPWRVPNQVLQPNTFLKSCLHACVADKPHCILNVPVSAVKNAIKKELGKK
jgi:ADP-heptose:LPS heptosyltransferase